MWRGNLKLNAKRFLCAYSHSLYSTEYEVKKTKKWQDAVDLLELPIQGPGLKGGWLGWQGAPQ